MRRTILFSLAAIGLLFCGARQANANAITYTESATATGTIGGTSFSNALVTITVIGNTSGITGSAPLFDNIGTSGSVTIGGIGTFTLTGTQIVFDNQVSSTAGITDAPPANDLMDTTSSVFATYGLATSIGPITGPAIFSPATPFGTSGGTLVLSSLPGSTFEATVGAVPEPGSLLLVTMGIAVLGAVRRRRQA